MELLFVMLGGAILGIVARYVVPGRRSHGAMLVPALGASAAGIVWAALTWMGLAFDGGWIWVITFMLAAIVPLAFALITARRRASADVSMLARLSHA